jgi:hypothetical protein
VLDLLDSLDLLVLLDLTVSVNRFVLGFSLVKDLKCACATPEASLSATSLYRGRLSSIEYLSPCALQAFQEKAHGRHSYQ